MSCSLCNSFQGAWPIESPDKPPFESRDHGIEGFKWDGLIASAETCYCCGILLAGARGLFKQHEIRESEIQHGSLDFRYPESLGDVRTAFIRKEMSFQIEDGRKFNIEISSVDDATCPLPASWDCFPTLRRMSPWLDPMEVPEIVKSWLKQCLEHHGPSCKSPTPSDMPTRLIDVGCDDGIVRLVEYNGERSHYLCLSHCWGEVQIITTTRATIEGHKRGIAWEQLSRTFQDAIAVTRALQYRYLWIDSLCIIQDDLRDWEKESAKMASVYTNGFMTIAGTRSANGNGGLFSKAQDIEINGTTPFGEPYRLFFREPLKHQIGTELEDTRRLHPLFDRAWVYQERMLSIRILHFGRYELFYECNSDMWCECGVIAEYALQHSIIDPLMKVQYASILERSAPLVNEKTDPAQLYKVAQLWRTMVTAYTDLLLTKSKDRLPALGGLARQMGTARKSRYLAGLWEDSLNDDLLWEGSPHPRPYPRTAPTWSWASVDKFTPFFDYLPFDESFSKPRPPYEHLAIIEECAVTPSGIDEFGATARGTLRVTSLFITGWLECDVKQFEGRQYAVDIRMCLPTGKWDIMPDYAFQSGDADRVEPMASIHCFRMSFIEEPSWARGQCLYSMVLRKAPGQPDIYERIGLLRQEGNGQIVDPVGELYRDAETRTVTIM